MFLLGFAKHIMQAKLCHCFDEIDATLKDMNEYVLKLKFAANVIKFLKVF